MTIFDMIADEIQDMEATKVLAHKDPDKCRGAKRLNRLQGGIDALKRLWIRLDEEGFDCACSEPGRED